MLDFAIQTRELTRHFGSHLAVNRLGLDVPKKSIYGFLGHNGAGKSTTIRLILGLLTPDSGSIRLFGESLTEKRTILLRRIGALIEAPSLYEHLTGRENLELTRQLRGDPPQRTDRVLDVVGLRNDADRCVFSYSMGMKQRLGLALALIGKPDLLVLDEPTSGLDPAGMHSVRSLIESLPEREGVTVFLSSHLLVEIERMASHVGIIHEGEMIFQNEIGSLLEQKKQHVLLGTNRVEDAAQLLRNAGFNLEIETGHLSISQRNCETAAHCNALLVNAGFDVNHLSIKESSLEDMFLDVTSRSKRGNTSK